MSNFLRLLKSNWKSGLTVALVSIPMSVSLAVASGTTPTVGIITAMWAGLMGSIFGGSSFNITGPAGALTGILASFALLKGGDLLPMLAIISGVFIFISYLLKLERYLIYIPASTVHGFTLGVGLILALGQLNYAFGLDNLPKHSEFVQNVLESLRHVPSLHTPTFVLFIVFLAFLFALLKWLPKVPGVIALSPIAIIIGYFSSKGDLPFVLQTLGSKFQNIKPALFLAHPFHFDTSLIIPGLTVAAVAILETMLCAKIADGMAGTKYNKRKEMFSLSISNIISGLFGGLPATAVLARTSLNVKSGATHRISQGFNAFCVFLISFIFLTTFKFIPLSAVAAILVFVSYRMIEQHHFIRMYKHDKKGFFIALLAAAVTVYYDPMIGILTGTAISLLLFVEKLSRGQFDLVVNDINKKIAGRIMTDQELNSLPENSDTLVYSLKGQLAYINAQAHISRFEENKTTYKNIILRLRELYFVDLDGVDAFDELVELIEKKGKIVAISGLNPLIEKDLKKGKKLAELRAKNLIFEKTQDALRSFSA